ncbi:MAG: type II toxin-antitoxin system VapC family toxin [Opitutaceae bacterium]
MPRHGALTRPPGRQRCLPCRPPPANSPRRRVIDETLTLAKARTNAATAVALLDRIERSEAIVVESITLERFAAAKAFFRKHADHGYSFTDCTSFVVMRELGLTDALTTDRHFSEAGFNVLLPVA